ncbi:MAG: transposase [Pseudomonadota bacterium]|nr:transposase [Pseudomonadota bacterium]
MCERTYGRWSRRVFPYTELNRELLLRTQEMDEHWIASIDASFIPKSGKITEGIGYFYSGCTSKVQRGLEMSLVSVVDLKANTGFSLLAKQTRVEQDQTSPEKNKIDQALDQIRECSADLRQLKIHDLVANAWYSKEKFVNGVVEEGFNMIGKLRQDAHLKFLFTGKYTGKGRPKKYDGRVKFTDLRRFTKTEMPKEDFDLYSKVVWSHSMKREILVVVLRNRGEKKKILALLYTTNLSTSPVDVLQKYRARFQIEFVIRDAKQHTGLNHSQARTLVAIENHFNQSLIALNLLKIEDQQQAPKRIQKVISFASWRRRKFNQHLAKIVFCMFGSEANKKKIKQVIENIGCYGAISA